ncbi:hypothetical protein Tco_0374161 [Tanacetum coccineum]
MADSAWIEAMQDELHQFDNIKVRELVRQTYFGKLLIEKQVVMEEQKGRRSSLLTWKRSDFCCLRSTQVFSNLSDGLKTALLNGPPLKRKGKVMLLSPKGSFIQIIQKNLTQLRKALYGLKQAPIA